MKKGKIFLLTIISILLLSINVYAEGSISLSKTSLTVKEGQKATFIINVKNAAGVIEVSSSDTSIATVDTSKIFVDSYEKGQISVNVTGKKAGAVTVSVVLKDVATYDGEVLSGTKTVAVEIVKASGSSTKPAENTKPQD